jgi:peptidoglycan/LPS O-acetylase OafA/YrhL
MAAASIAFADDAACRRVRDLVPWAKLLTILTVCLVAALALKPAWLFERPLVSETAVGFVTAVALARYALAARAGDERTPNLRFMNARPTVALGMFSYSIYLIHSPLLGLFNLMTLDLDISTDLRQLVMLLVAVPLAVLVSYGFHLLVERRFMSGHQRVVSRRQGIP